MSACSCFSIVSCCLSLMCSPCISQNSAPFKSYRIQRKKPNKRDADSSDDFELQELRRVRTPLESCQTSNWNKTLASTDGQPRNPLSIGWPRLAVCRQRRESGPSCRYP